MVHETVIEIFSTKMGITSSGLYFENSLLNSKKGYIESSSAMIEDENVTFTGNFLVETVSDRSSRRLECSFPKWFQHPLWPAFESR